MKGIIVFDDRSDLAFYSLDKEMELYIKDRVRQLEGEAGAEVSTNIFKLYNVHQNLIIFRPFIIYY